MEEQAKKQKTKQAIEALKQLLLSGNVSSQEEIRLGLLEKGLEVNQSKISRMLRKIGAVRTTNEDGNIIYLLPRDIVPPSTKSPLSQLVVDIRANESLIVIRTMPGSASLIARLLDHHQQELNILGTVAGDDTLFVAPKAAAQNQQTLQAIHHLLDRMV